MIYATSTGTYSENDDRVTAERDVPNACWGEGNQPDGKCGEEADIECADCTFHFCPAHLVIRDDNAYCKPCFNDRDHLTRQPNEQIGDRT